MKKQIKENRRHGVPTDEPFVDYENLVTGAKFNYDRPQPSEREISDLCVSEKWSKREKFVHILEEGERIQKWSVLENLRIYAADADNSQLIFEKIIKNYTQVVQFLPILADGLINFLDALTRHLTQTQVQLLFNFTFRVLTQNADQVDDWAPVFKAISHYPYLPRETCIEYINGSFAMNSHPERRRVALEMMEALLKSPSNLEESARTKVLFFNQDQNSKTRQTICKIMHCLLAKNPEDEEIWKAIWEYFHDKNEKVKESAMNTLTNIYWEKNFKSLLHLFSEDQDEILVKNIDRLVLTFKANFEHCQQAKIELIAFCNRIFKSKNIHDAIILLKKLNSDVMSIIGFERIQEEVNFSLLQIKEKALLEQLFPFYHHLHTIQLRETLKFFIYKGLKEAKYQIGSNAHLLASIFDLQREEEIQIFITVCNSLLERSKWHPLLEMMKKMQKIHPYQSTYDRLSLLMLKIFMQAPYFVLPQVLENIVYLLLINRRSLEFLITIREKILNSKFWVYRRNYIKLYKTLKVKTSFDYHKLIPSLLYKSISSEKNYGVKLAFLEEATHIYQNTDPNSLPEKNAIRETVEKLQEDRDSIVRITAVQVFENIKALDSRSDWLSELYSKNNEASMRQEEMKQILPDPKKTIKTENEIRKSMVRKRGTIETRKTINIGKSQIHKDMSIGSIDTINSVNLMSKGLSSQSKRPNLFRCHSVKIKAPTKKK